jgi:hypothetical protein
MARRSTIINRSNWKISEIELDDLHELNRELRNGVKGLEGTPKEIGWITNMISQKLDLVRSLVHAERILDNRRVSKEVVNV